MHDIVALVTAAFRIPAIALVLTSALCAADAEYPQAEIASDTVSAKLYLPDPEHGYYRGTRFDWSGQIYSLKAGGHEYFGQWFEKYDPKLHDAIQGPVEEFRTNGAGLGYDEAKVGDTFIRIGVGSVRKPEEKAYQAFRTYEIVDPGKWNFRKGKDWVEFTHELSDRSGYAYRYTKTIRLAGGKPEMKIEHRLKNTGKKAFSTQQYNHNFFVIDEQPTGPDATVQFPFTLTGIRPTHPELADVQGGKITYTRELVKGDTFMNEFTGYGNSASDYDVRVENRKAGAGVRIVGDKPIVKLVYWSIRKTLCPEAYIELQVDPGKEAKWSYNYTFYSLDKQPK